MNKVPLYKPWYDQNEIDAVSNLLKTKSKLTRGNIVRHFEELFAAKHGLSHGIATSSATTALHIALRYITGTGNKVITTPFSYIASANVALYENKEVIFCDIHKDSLLIDESALENLLRLHDDVAAVVYVDIHGNLPRTNIINEICHKFGVYLIEDASQAILSANGTIQAGHLGDCAVYSFHENKQMTTLGEGGMILTNDQDFADFARSLKNQGRVSSNNWMHEMRLGYNYRMTEVQAAFGIEQLNKIEENLQRRRNIISAYVETLKISPQLFELPQDSHPSQRSWFTYTVLLTTPEMRADFMKILNEQDIEHSTTYFPPMYYLAPHKDNKYRNAFLESYYTRCISLPLFAEMSPAQIQKVTSCIKDLIKLYEK